MEIVDEDPSGAWVDVDDLNDPRMGRSTTQFLQQAGGYIILGRVLLAGLCAYQGEKPAEDGRPWSSFTSKV